MTAIQALGEQGFGVEGVHVHVRDRPPVEKHWVADIRRDIFSASKTFTSVAVGIAQAEGLLDGDDLVLSHFATAADAMICNRLDRRWSSSRAASISLAMRSSALSMAWRIPA